jgi:hypothetical protein
MCLKTPVGVKHTALKATENSMEKWQGKRLRGMLNGNFSGFLSGKGGRSERVDRQFRLAT